MIDDTQLVCLGLNPSPTRVGRKLQSGTLEKIEFWCLGTLNNHVTVRKNLIDSKSSMTLAVIIGWKLRV